MVSRATIMNSVHLIDKARRAELLENITPPKLYVITTLNLKVNEARSDVIMYPAYSGPVLAVIIMRHLRQLWKANIPPIVVVTKRPESNTQWTGTDISFLTNKGVEPLPPEIVVYCHEIQDWDPLLNKEFVAYCIDHAKETLKLEISEVTNVLKEAQEKLAQLIEINTQLNKI